MHLRAIFRQSSDSPASLVSVFRRLALLKIAMVGLLLLWIAGMLTHHTMGGFVHALLVLAAVLWLVNVVRGPNS
ncbi:MAG TPA: lmo0937 family membrane protein [Terriglobales bacterium]|nr:lmo0937 family membrane protein [Terriglobales bacterium]